MGGKTEDEEIKEPEEPAGQPAPTEGGMGTANEDAGLAEIEAALAGAQSGKEADEDKGLQDAGSPAEAIQPSGAASLPTTEVPLPPAESTTGALPFGPEVYEEFSPTGGSTSQNIPLQKDALPADPKLVRHFIKDERINRLWNRADNIQDTLTENIHTVEIGRQLLDQVKYARNYLLAGRDYYEEAERHVNEVEFILKQNLQARKWSLSYGVPLFIYELVWGIALILLFLALQTPVFAGFNTDIRGMLATMICGGLGGVTGAWFSLIKHTSQDQDFDKQHTMWYLNSPLMSATIGAFVYWIMRGGLIAITVDSKTAVEAPYLIYILAWLAGYQHNVFTNIVKRVIKIFEGGSSGDIAAEEKPKETPPPPPPPSPSGAEEGPSKKG